MTVREARKTGGGDAPEKYDLQGNIGDFTVDVENSNLTAPTIGFTFEKDLRASRPYMRALKRCSGWTATSSVAPSMGWSFFSDISLAEVSCLSAIALPIASQDLWNGDRYRVKTSDRHNRFEIPRPVLENISERILHSMARNMATSLVTTTDLNNYKLSSSDGFMMERKALGEKKLTALLGMVHSIRSLQPHVWRY